MLGLAVKEEKKEQKATNNSLADAPYGEELLSTLATRL